MQGGLFERANALGQLVFEHLEVVWGEAIDGVSTGIDNGEVEHDEVNVDVEHILGLGKGRRKKEAKGDERKQ